MARFVEIISRTSGGAERRVPVPIDQFVTELTEQSTFPESGGGGSFEPAANSPADGVDTEFTFSGTPVMVFRNGVNETRLGTIAGSAFTFDSAPSADDDIEALT